MNEKPQKFTKNAQNARSGPWWDRTRPKLGLETTTIVFSIQIGFRNRTNLLLILKSRFCWTQLLPYATLVSSWLRDLWGHFPHFPREGCPKGV